MCGLVWLEQVLPGLSTADQVTGYTFTWLTRLPVINKTSAFLSLTISAAAVTVLMLCARRYIWKSYMWKNVIERCIKILRNASDFHQFYDLVALMRPLRLVMELSCRLTEGWMRLRLHLTSIHGQLVSDTRPELGDKMWTKTKTKLSLKSPLGFWDLKIRLFSSLKPFPSQI